MKSMSQSAPEDFAVVQEWFVTLLRHSGTIDEAWHAESAVKLVSPEQADMLSKPAARGLTGRDRVDIYRTMYYARLIEALAVDVPITRYCMGEAKFEAIATEYFMEHPSRSYTLNRVSDAFPDYLAHLMHSHNAKRHAYADDDIALLSAIARVELMAVWAFDAPVADALSVDALRSIPPEQYGAMRLKTHPAVFLHTSAYPILSIIETMESLMERDQDNAQENTFADMHNRISNHSSTLLTTQDEEAILASLYTPTPTYILTYRPVFVAEHTALEFEQYILLSALLSGATLEQSIQTLLEQPAVAGALESNPEHTQTLLQSVMAWFAEWLDMGIFTAVECG